MSAARLRQKFYQPIICLLTAAVQWRAFRLAQLCSYREVEIIGINLNRITSDDHDDDDDVWSTCNNKSNTWNIGTFPDAHKILI